MERARKHVTESRREGERIWESLMKKPGAGDKECEKSSETSSWSKTRIARALRSRTKKRKIVEYFAAQRPRKNKRRKNTETWRRSKSSWRTNEKNKDQEKGREKERREDLRRKWDERVEKISNDDELGELARTCGETAWREIEEREERMSRHIGKVWERWNPRR